jgi:threonine dehydratase
VPVGGGSGASGASIVAKIVNSAIQVIAVQAQNAPAAYQSYKQGRPIEADTATFAEGLATRVAFDLPQKIMGRYLDDFVLVSEDELKRSVLWMLEHTHNLAEGAGAAALAGAVQIQDRLQGKKVVLVQSGGNLSLERLREILT